MKRRSKAARRLAKQRGPGQSGKIGRPADPNARRRQTTRAGRKGQPYVDFGTAEARARRLLATGLESLPVDPLAILLGRGHIDNRQYAAGRDLGEQLALVRAGLGVVGDGTQSAWSRILAGGGGGGGKSEPPSIERAWRLLARLRRRIGSERTAALTFAIADGEWTPLGYPIIQAILAGRLDSSLRAVVALVQHGLDRVAKSWASGRQPLAKAGVAGVSPGLRDAEEGAPERARPAERGLTAANQPRISFTA